MYSYFLTVKWIQAQCLDKQAERKKSNELLKRAIEAYGDVADKPDVPVELLKETLMTRSKRQVQLFKFHQPTRMTQIFETHKT